jgi:hypothetical protein
MMSNLQRYAPRQRTMRDVERWVRAVLPRNPPPSSPLPRVLGAIALVLAGAAAALLLTPKNGVEMRTMARKRLQKLQKTATEFAASHDPRAMRGNGRAGESQGERSRRSEATS